MKQFLSFLLMVVCVSIYAGQPAPVVRNWYTTNANPLVTVQAGTNCFVTQLQTPTTRTFIVDVPTNGPSGSSIGVGQSSTVGIITNGTVVTPFVQGTLTNNTTGNAATSSAMTNGTISGPTLVGTVTNTGSTYWTGGEIRTNYATGNWMKYTNGVSSWGLSNNGATITADGTIGVITIAGTAPSLSLTPSGGGSVNVGVGGSTNLLIDKPVTATSFSGIGTSLTALNASALTSGTVAAGLLPGVAILSNANTFTATNTFGGVLTKQGVSGYGFNGIASTSGSVWYDSGFIAVQGAAVHFLDTIANPRFSFGQGSSYDLKLAVGGRIVVSTSTSAEGTAGTVITFTNGIATSTGTFTNGVVLPQLTAIPTNAIATAGCVATATVTNWCRVNLTNTINGGGLMEVATNSVNGGYLINKATSTVSTF